MERKYEDGKGNNRWRVLLKYIKRVFGLDITDVYCIGRKKKIGGKD